MREGLSSDCKLDPLIIMAIMMGGKEHPCDRCNMDRKECRGYPSIDETQPSVKSEAEKQNDKCY